MLNNSANLLQIPLPLPDIKDEYICYTRKKPSKRNQFAQPKAPRLKARVDHFNRSYHNSTSNLTGSAQSISFRSESNDCTEADTFPLSSSCYDNSSKDTFFEQCFERLEKIGEGSFGEVFKVRSKEDGKLYAVKMSKETFRGEHYRAERIEEVRRYQQFTGHDNCIRFFRAWQQDDRLYMQMELCRESLDDYAAKHKDIPEEQVWEILLDLLLGLKSLHDKNLIHLDIKLDNVLITDDGTCKLADFGLVINVDKANKEKTTEGDSRYIAPEIMAGVFTKAADIFSLGIAMLELCCYLELPPNGALWQDLRRGQLPESFFASRSEELRSMIKDMMDSNPRNRPTVDQLLATKRLSSLLRRRKTRWMYVRSVSSNISRYRRLLLAKICNFKYLLINFFSKIARRWNWLPPVAKDYTPKKKDAWEKPSVNIQLIGSTPIGNRLNPISDFIDEDVSLDISQGSTPRNFAQHHMMNSTPLSCNQRNTAQRRRLTRASLSPFDTPMCYHSPSVEFSTNNSCMDNNDTCSNSFRKCNESSLLRRKKLFDAMDDEY